MIYVIILAIILIIVSVFINLTAKNDLMYLISAVLFIMSFIMLFALPKSKTIPVKKIDNNTYICVKNFKNYFFDENTSEFLCKKEIFYIEK